MSSSYVEDNFYKDIRQVDNQQIDKSNKSPTNRESNNCVDTISSCASDGDRNSSNRSQQTKNFAANKDVHHVKDTNNNLVTMSTKSRHDQAIVVDDVQNQASNRKFPNNHSEFMIYRLLERANLLCYFETFVQLGGDDVQQLCDADDEEFLEIMDFVGMTKKPLHVRRLQKTLLEWKKSPDVFNRTVASSTNSMSLCHTDASDQLALKATSDSRSSTTLSMGDKPYIPDRALAPELNSTEGKQSHDNIHSSLVDIKSLPDDNGVTMDDFYAPRSESMLLASTLDDKYSSNDMMTSQASTSNTSSSSRSSLGIRDMSRQHTDQIEGLCYKKICNQSSSIDHNSVDRKSKSIDHLHQKSVAEILRGQNDMISCKQSIGRINMQLSDNTVKQSTLHYKLSNNSTKQITCLAHVETSPSTNNNAHDLTQQQLLLFPSSQYKDSVIALERRRHHNMVANALEYQNNYVTNGMKHVMDNLNRSDSIIRTPIVAINSPTADINAITSCQRVLIDKSAAENYELHIIPTSAQMALPIVEPLNVETRRIAFDFQQCPTNLVKNHAHQQQSDTIETNIEHKICDTGRNEKSLKPASISVSTSPQNCFEFLQQERKSDKLSGSKNLKKDMVSKSSLKSCEVSIARKELCPSNTYANVLTKATTCSDNETIVQVDVDDSDPITMSKETANSVLRSRKNGNRKNRQELQHAFRGPS